MPFLRMLIALTLAFGAALGVVPAASAATNCVIGDSVEQCWNRYLPESAPAAQTVSTGANAGDAKAAATDVETELKSFETGLGGGTPELATTTRNLLPLLAASGLISDSDRDANDQLFTLDLNFLLGDFAKDHNAQLRAVLSTDPQVFEPLKTAFDTATGGTDRSTALQKDLSSSDDYAIAFTYSHINKRFGRSFKQYQVRYSNLFEAAISAGTGPGVKGRDPALVMADVLQKLNARTNEPELTESTVLHDERALDAVESAARSEANIEQRVRQAITFNKLSRFAELVNNQPQLTVSAELHERDELVGTKEQAIKVAYEFGLANVNRFEASSNRVCSVLDDEVRELSFEAASRCLDRFRSYIDKNEQRLKNADRFGFEASYVEMDDYDFTSPTDGVSLAKAGTHRLDMAIGFGRTLQVVGDKHDSRLDIVAKYEDYSDDPDYRDRLVGTITLTTKLNGISIPLALVYANHGKFLPETDEQLSVHIGIKYQLDQKQD